MEKETKNNKELKETNNSCEAGGSNPSQSNRFSRVIGEISNVSVRNFINDSNLFDQKKDFLTDLRKAAGLIIRLKYDVRGKFNLPADVRTFETVQELKDFLVFFKNPKYKVFFKLLAWTGVRKGELLKVSKEDFDFKNNNLYINITKTNVGNIFVPVPEKLMSEIKLLFEYAVLSDDPFSHCNTESKKLFRKVCDSLKGKYDKTYAESSTGRKLFYFNIVCFRKFFQTMIYNGDLLGYALHNSPAIAKKHYLSKIGRIRTIINELY
jgi:integrase